MSIQAAASILYPTDPFKAASAATDNLSAASSAPKPATVADIKAKPADSANVGEEFSSTFEAAATLYPDSAFETADRFGINEHQPMPENADQLTIEMGPDFEPSGDPDELQAAKSGLFEAGINQSLLSSLSADYQRHAFEPVTITADECMADLRKEWGPATDAKMQMARDMVNQAAKTWPGVWDVIERYGTGNDPNVIRKIVARAEQLKRNGKL